MALDSAAGAANAGVAAQTATAGRAALAAAAVLAIMAALPMLRGQSLLGADNDSMLRLVEVRDLIAGQGWFDPMQYRLGPEGGIEMHWSRLVDAPIAALILLAGALGLSTAAAETFTLIAWPALLSVPALYAIIRAARGLGGDEAVLPAAAIGAAALFYSGQFNPGSIDHHSSQATLALLAIMAMATERLTAATGAFAGAAIALMAGIGAETHPHVALAGFGAAAIFILDDKARDFAIGFGIAFAGVLAAIFFGTIAPAHYWRTACDAISIAQVAPGVAGGLALAAAAALSPTGASAISRLARLAATGVAAALAGGPFAVSCFGDPLAGVDPLVREYWLDSVEEARPLFSIGVDNPSIGLSYGAPPLIALGWTVWSLARGRPKRPLLVVGGAIVVSYAIALVQVRGAVLAMLFAAIPLAAFVASARARALSAPNVANQGAMIGAWLFSFAMVWALIGAGLDPRMRALLASSAEEPPVETPACTLADSMRALREQPKTTVLAISNLGSAILLNTPHRALAGPYHRNVAGLKSTIAALIAPDEKAEGLVRASGAALVASCAENPETRYLAHRHPDGLAARLAAGRQPGWLTPIGPQTGPLRLYKLVQPG